MRRLLSLGLAGVAATCLAFFAVVLSSSGAQSATPYTQVVDNTTQGRFAAPNWGTSSYSAARLGANYRYVEPRGTDRPAMYKFDIPKTARYSVFIRTPSNSGYNGTARVGIETASGLQWETVNQKTGGGQWKKLGFYKLDAGDKSIVRIAASSRSEGYIVADGMKVVRGDVAATQNASNGGGSTSGGGGNSSGGGSVAVTGADVVQEAKSWLGVPYRYGGTSRSGVDCSGLTLSVYRALGISLNRTAVDQFNGGPGTKVAKNDLGRGYLVFGNAGGSGIQHVGIITGDGRMIHSPQPGTVVRYDNLPASWYNILGVKRIVPAA